VYVLLIPSILAKTYDRLLAEVFVVFPEVKISQGAQKDGVTEWFIAAFRLESVMTPLARRPRFGVDKRTTRMTIAFAHGVRFTKMTQ